MSLINDVLRQVDNRSKAQGDGLSFGYVGHEGEQVVSNSKRIHYWLFAVIIGVSAYFITNHLSFFISSNNELSSLGSESNNSKSFDKIENGQSQQEEKFLLVEDENGNEVDDFDEALLLLDIEAEAENIEAENIESRRIESLDISNQSKASEIDSLSDIQPVTQPHVVSNEVIKSKASQTKQVTRKPKQQKTVKKTRKTGIDEYNKALAHYNRSEFSQAIHWANQAIAESKKEPYVQLLLRSHLANRNKSSFVSTANGHDYTSYAWLSIKASGMHLFDEHHQAIEAFKALIGKGQNTEKWKIALALSYESVGEIHNAKSVYQNLLDKHLLSGGQKRQVKNKLSQLSDNKEKQHGS